MRRTAFVVILAVALAMTLTGIAYANFGPHGGYETDTDSCAGCHRAHTSASPVVWTDSYDTTHTALLVGTAQTMKEFCYACHGDDAPGASTNVQSGIFDGGPSGANGTGNTLGALNDGVQVAYITNSQYLGDLNGGGFDSFKDKTTTSMHNMEFGAGTDPMWGSGNSAPAGKNLTCTDCHDPHGSSNYRLLKDALPASGGGFHEVGGYPDGSTPNGFVISAEQGFPATSTLGWLKHTEGAVQMENYRPNYTSPEYAFDPAYAAERSMSVWCAGCHEQYNQTFSWYDYGDAETWTVGATTYAMGNQARHRHAVDISMAAGTPGPTMALQVAVTTNTAIPLEARKNSPNPRGTWDLQDNMGCLTCHRAHGTSVDMTGWAEASLITTNGVYWYPQRQAQNVTSGVNPNFTSALLRADNRGVCERCHNK